MAAGENKLAITGDDEPVHAEAGINYLRRAQWIRPAVLGANDGLLSTSALMMGVAGADSKAVLVSGFAGLVAGAFSMAIGEYVSVHSQLDVELARMKRDGGCEGREKLPSPLMAAAASAVAFVIGAVVPFAVGFIRRDELRMGVLVGATATSLVAFGGSAAKLGRAPIVRSIVRVLVGGLVAMGFNFGTTKLFGRVI